MSDIEALHKLVTWNVATVGVCSHYRSPWVNISSRDNQREPIHIQNIFKCIVILQIRINLSEWVDRDKRKIEER